MNLLQRCLLAAIATGSLGLAGCSGGAQPLAGSLPAAPNGGSAAKLAPAGTPLLYVADQANQTVWIFSQAGGSPIGKITDAIAAPDGIFVDVPGTLYVANFGSGTVTEYPNGQTTHSKTLTGPTSPKYVAVGHDGTVYVSDFHGSTGGSLYEYAGGSTTPTTVVPFTSFPAGVAVDRLNRVDVAYNDTANNDIEIVRLVPGKTTGKNLGIHVKFGYAGGLAVDKNGDILLANQAAGQVLVFPPGATSPSQTYSNFTIAYQLTLNHLGTKLFVGNAFTPEVDVDTYPAGAPKMKFTASLKSALGVATYPDNPY